MLYLLFAGVCALPALYPPICIFHSPQINLIAHSSDCAFTYSFMQHAFIWRVLCILMWLVTPRIHSFIYSPFNRHLLETALSPHLVSMCWDDRSDNTVVLALEEPAVHRGHHSLTHKERHCPASLINKA